MRSFAIATLAPARSKMPAPSQFLRDRHSHVRAQLSELRLDALVVTHQPNILYLTNHSASAGVVVVTTDGLHLLADFRYRHAIERLQASDRACPDLVAREVPASYDEALVDVLAEIGAKRVGIEALHMPVARFNWLVRTVQHHKLAIEIVPTERVIERQRMVKDEWERQALRTAASRITSVAKAAFDSVRGDASEREVAAAIEQALRASGFDRLAFDTIVASGPHSALPHYRAGDRRLRSGDLVVLDFGGVLDGYCCDLTRTVAVGSAGPEAARVHAAVREAQTAAIEAVRPGVAASQVDAAARAVLEARGLGQAFGHGTGHGLGIEVHEDPRVGKPQAGVPATMLQPGMVFTIEPGAYLPDWGGVRIEDDVMVTEDGCEVLTSVTSDLLVR